MKSPWLQLSLLSLLAAIIAAKKTPHDLGEVDISGACRIRGKATENSLLRIAGNFRELLCTEFPAGIPRNL